MYAACVLFLMLAFLAVGQGTPGQQCGPPEIPRYGSIVGGVRDTYDVGDFVRYSCDSGFELQGSIVAVCIHTASQGAHWNKPPPRCIGRYKLLVSQGMATQEGLAYMRDYSVKGAQ